MSIEAEAQMILENLTLMPFETCYPLSRNFLDVPTCPGLYAVRHCDQGILYIGQTTKLRRRFKDGHKAFFWAFLDYCSPNQIRIAIERLNYESLQRAEEIEIWMIRHIRPPYNSLVK